MSENFQSSPFFGTESALQSSLPVLNNATPSAGSVCNFSRVPTPAVSSAWPLPSATSTSLQPLMGSAYLYQHAGATMLTELTDQSQVSTSALSYPGVLQWDITGSTDGRAAALQDFTVTIIDQNTTLSSLSMTAQCDNILDPNAIVPFYPTLSASLVQATPPQVLNQGYSMTPSYQEGSQVYYYDHNSLGSLIAGELRQCLQAYGCMSYAGSRASAPQPEMVMVLKEIQPEDVQSPLSTSTIYYPTSAESMPDTRLQVMETSMETETSLGMPSASQVLCGLQTTGLHNTYSQVSQINNHPDLGDMLLIAHIHSPSEFLALPPAPSLEQAENKNVDEVKAELAKSLDPYEGTKENQDPSLLPLAHPGREQPLHCTDAGSLKQKSASDNDNLGSSSLGLEEQGVEDTETGSSIDFADISTLVADIHLPQLFNSLTDLDQFQDPTTNKSKDSTVIQRDPAQENTRVISGLSDQVWKNDHRASELFDGAPQAKIQGQDPECLVEGEGALGSAGASDRAPDNMAKQSEDKAQKAATSRPSRAGGHGQDKTKRTRENDSKKTEELKQSRNRVKSEEKTTVPKTKRKRNPHELTHDTFKKPRSQLGMHMLESVQVFHPLGKKSEKKTGISSSRALGNFSSSKDLGSGPGSTSLLDMPPEGRGSDKMSGKAQKAESSAHKKSPSPSQYELPPPGKVKLVPLPFPAPDKPPARPASRKPLSLASRRRTTAYPAQPHYHSAQPPTLKPAQPAPANTALKDSAKPTLQVYTSVARPNTTNPIQSSIVPQLPSSRPAPYRASSHTSLQKELVSAARNKEPSPPKTQTQYLLQDFSRQPIPWRKVDIPGPVISQPITREQRPEREAMKRRAQQERQHAAKYTSLGKLQFFLQREKDMEISQYYGYAM